MPTLVLFVPGATITHITTLDQLNTLYQNGDVIEIPLNGTPFNRVSLPNLTFHCSVVSAAVYAHGVPFTGWTVFRSLVALASARTTGLPTRDAAACTFCQLQERAA
jgi:hypothetical protein